MDAAIPMWAFYAVLFLFIALIVILMHRVMKDESNPIGWWQFISSVGRDGKERADLTKLMQLAGGAVSIWLLITLSARIDKLDWTGFLAILLAVLAYLAGVQTYQMSLKAKTQASQTETTNDTSDTTAPRPA